MKKVIFGLIAFLIIIGSYTIYHSTRKFSSDNGVRIFIPHSATAESIHDTLSTRLGNDFGDKVFTIWKTLSNDPAASHGSYVVNSGEKAYKVANRIAKGRQTPVKVTVNVARTLTDLSNAIAANVEASPSQIIEAMDSVINGPRAIYTAEILPDTYEVYWTDSPSKIISTLLFWNDKFWNEARLEKAKKLGLSPIEVVTLASIVEEESNKADEQPVIARLYLNRLKKGMKLQADPTVKFALNNFALRRISHKHLETDSPYNTYRIAGLPPGPIRVPQKATIDAVLNAPHNDYLYMCAKEDLSGYHNFTADYNTHLKNARKYASELDRRGIR